MDNHNNHESNEEIDDSKGCSKRSNIRNHTVKSSKSMASLKSNDTDTQDKDKMNYGMHNWTRRHFWALHILTFLLAVSCSWSLLFWINIHSGISMKETQLIGSQLQKVFFAIEMEPGTIVAWAPNEDFRKPPNKWVICDGRLIEEGPWKDRKTPDLTGAFLIGGTQKLVLDGSEETLAKKNKDEFCFECGVNKTDAETARYSFNVTYIMKIPASGLW